MSNIFEILEPTTLKNKINDYYYKNYIPRKRLGISQIGHPCPAWLWMTYRGLSGEIPSGQILRLFELGNIYVLNQLI